MFRRAAAQPAARQPEIITHVDFLANPRAHRLRPRPARRAARPADVGQGHAAAREGAAISSMRRCVRWPRSSIAWAKAAPTAGATRRASSNCSTTPRTRPSAAGLWNFFLPDADTGEGLSNLDYAYIAVELGKSPLASEIMNCAAPDTGNMEVLERVGTPAQKEQWLEPAARRRDPLRLRDDRAGHRLVRRQERRHPRRRWSATNR